MKGLLYISILFVSLNSFGQKLSASTSEKKILIGEPITLTYTVKTKKDVNIEFEADTESILARSFDGGTVAKQGVEFEILERFTDTNKIKNNDKEWVGRYTITVWDSGAYIIPGAFINIDDSTYQFKDVRIYADYTKQKKDVNLYDIHESYAKIPPEPIMDKIARIIRNYWPWFLILIIAGISYGFYRFVQKRKRREPPKLYKAMSLKERTLLAIEALENEKMWENDQLKEHFVELSYILRSYLTARYNESLLEKTTYETKLLLTRKGLDEDTVDNIARILSEADMVKFAKSKPEVISILRVSTLAKQIVAETSPLEFDNVE